MPEWATWARVKALTGRALYAGSGGRHQDAARFGEEALAARPRRPGGERAGRPGSACHLVTGPAPATVLRRGRHRRRQGPGRRGPPDGGGVRPHDARRPAARSRRRRRRGRGGQRAGSHGTSAPRRLRRVRRAGHGAARRRRGRLGGALRGDRRRTTETTGSSPAALPGDPAADCRPTRGLHCSRPSTHGIGNADTAGAAAPRPGHGSSPGCVPSAGPRSRRWRPTPRPRTRRSRCRCGSTSTGAPTARSAGRAAWSP